MTQKKINKKYSIQVNEVKARKAKICLQNNLADIGSTSDWARLCMCSRTQLHQIINNYYGVTPANMISRARYKRIITMLYENPDMTSSYAAYKVGLRDEQGMYKFLSRKYGTNFTELRYCIINHRI